MMGMIIPVWARWAMLAVLVAAGFGFGFVEGDDHGTAKLTAYIGEQAKEAVKIITRQGAITERVVTEYQDRVVKGATVTKTITNEVTKYVESKPLTLSCTLDAGWIRLHDAAALGAVPAAASATDAATGEISAAAALPTITDNYAKANRNADRLEALQIWVTEQAKK
jgi:hypothetical protein